jgi:4-hydroxy-2-oxoheptanedioate aldolase
MMRNSKLLAKVRSGQAARIAMMGHVLPPFIAFAAHEGYDAIWLDLEHRPMEQREVQMLLAFFHLYDIDCLIRPATREKAPLYRYLEDGATGFVIPHVSTPEEVRDLVRKVKFPPVGDRGLNPSSLEANFGLDLGDSRQPMVDHALQETFLLVQVETPQAVANLDAMAAVPGLDGFFVGPSDLALRMQHEPEAERIGYEATLEKLAAVCQQYDRVWGTTCKDAAELRRQYALGARLIWWGYDQAMLRDGLRQCRADLDTILVK